MDEDGLDLGALRDIGRRAVSGERPPPEPAADDGPPPAVPGYAVMRRVGAGGSGTVWEMWSLALHRKVAVKVLRADFADDPEARQRFAREARALARLHSPNVVTVHEHGETAGRPYLVMEWMDGGSLGERLGRPFEQRPAADLVRRLARTVAEVHAAGVVHRDIKPENVLFRSADDDVPVLADFGHARVAGPDTALTQAGTILGTARYMAPEQAAGREAGPAADVYALGGVLYELLTGRTPFTGGTLDVLVAVQADDPPPPSRLRRPLSRDLETIVLKCLEKDPRRRYESAAALADDLDRYLDGAPIRARPLGPVTRALRWVRRYPWPALAAGLAAMGVVAGLGGLFGWRELERRREVERGDAAEQRLALIGQTLRESAERLRDRGDYRGHVAALDQVLAQDPPDALDLTVSRARSLFAANSPRFRHELAALKDRDDLGRLQAAVLLLRGEEAFSDGNRQAEGRRLMEAALERRADLSPADGAYAEALLRPPGRLVEGLREVLRRDRYHPGALRCLPVALLVTGDTAAAREHAAALRLAFRDDPLPFLVEAMAATLEGNPAAAAEATVGLETRTTPAHAEAVRTFLVRLGNTIRSAEALNSGAAWQALALPGHVAGVMAAAGPALGPVAVPVPAVAALYETGTRVLSGLKLVPGLLFRRDEAALRKSVEEARALRDGCPEGLLAAVELLLQIELTRHLAEKRDLAKFLPAMEDLRSVSEAMARSPTLVPRSPLFVTGRGMQCMFEVIALQYQPEPAAGQLERLGRNLTAFAEAVRTPVGRSQREGLSRFILGAVESTVPPAELRQVLGHPGDEATLAKQRERRKRAVASVGRRLVADWVLDEPDRAAPWLAAWRLEMWDDNPHAAKRAAERALAAEPRNGQAAEALKKAEARLAKPGAK